jgi:hypothetical protein
LNADALDLWRVDRAKALRFYAQSWAFRRFLAEEAGTELSERLERWRAMCLGAALGADFRNPYGADRTASQELFRELFGEELDPLERAFREWLESR